MRLRKIKGADETVAASPYVIHPASEGPLPWKKLFANERPLHIEIGTGKGVF